MARYRLTVEYHGSGFVGWQRQDNGPSVQAALEDAVHAFSAEQITVFGAGRTDTGVHALAQVAHFDLEKEWPVDTVMHALNHHLKPAPVAVLDCMPADDEFHARFSAIGRRYMYRIVNRRAPLTVDRGLAWRVPQPLDAEAMHRAAQRLVGKHDFTTFRASQCQAKSPVKTLDRLDVARHGDDIRVTAEARSFLHNQVRAMVGSLRLLGQGKWTEDDLGAALEACDRTRCGPTAPPDGLYLTGVVYPD
jgi:tRNA pseudouridine38-40 synthase